MALAGCPGGGGSIGDRCEDHSDCGLSLQCVSKVCVEKCQRAPECGDGYACDRDGYCLLATGQPGDTCESEVQCAPGLRCSLDGTNIDPDTHQLLASCVAENAGSPPGAECNSDGECRNGTCALGHCVDLCKETRDCGAGTGCTLIPRVEAAMFPTPKFAGCLQSHGSLSWSIPIHGPSEEVLLPIPDSARSVAVTFSIDDLNQKVGALLVYGPNAPPTSATPPLVDTVDDYLNPDHYYTRPVRHRLDFGQSVLAMPSSPTSPLEFGAYRMTVASQRAPIGAGTATPTATAVIKLDSAVSLDLHFYFLNLDDHPCSNAFGGKLDATSAKTASYFQNEFRNALAGHFARGGVVLGTLTYEDLRDHPDLDALDVSNTGALLSLGAHDVGINVFFVRSISPVGLQAIGPNPGPAGLANTRQSGIVVGLDTLCYRSWSDLARLTAHELARYMGLYDNVDVDGHQDPIVDSDTDINNLMFYSEAARLSTPMLPGNDLSPGQRDILSRSPVLR